MSQTPTGGQTPADTQQPGTQDEQPGTGLSADWQDRYAQSLMGVFGTPGELLTSGDGCWVKDGSGRDLLDMLGGIAVNALGHRHPALLNAVNAQLSELGHISNLFASAPQIRLAEMLLSRAEAPAGSSVFFANSGSEANEAALKAVLRHRKDAGRGRILALEGSFHGRTTGALALTHKPAFREPFGDLLTGVEFIPPNDIAALEQALTDDVAGLFLEPIQGESGVKPLDDAYMVRARELTRERGSLLVYDEVQTGIGRTGEWFRFQGVQRSWGQSLAPDLMTLAKGLGSGFPIGALVAFGPVNSALLGAGQHGSTFGGNPLASAAGIATLQTLDDESLLSNAQAQGERIAAALRELPQVSEVRQYGLHIGIELHPGSFPGQPAPAQRLVTVARERAGLIINATGVSTLRLAPPLILTDDLAEEFVKRFTSSLKTMQDEESNER